MHILTSKEKRLEVIKSYCVNPCLKCCGNIIELWSKALEYIHIEIFKRQWMTSSGKCVKDILGSSKILCDGRVLLTKFMKISMKFQDK